ncbi:hypothetical protein [Paraflavitalea speifideaquila]|uniref:hypothetical protein n=1 Tax=Paraflavitalea speifideaquila TaxID=3076558 RepID=UPI0028E2DC4D|nr:hypothetical protein [Paraflavitalea speifideiaquila]
MKYRLFIVLLVIGSLPGTAQEATDSMLTKAQGYFETIRQVSATREAGLWGRGLAGPVMLVDTGSRKVYTNTVDKEGRLKIEGTVYTGQLPLTVNIANTATEWAGIRWTMLLLPLPASRYERVKLMAHELFHRIQDSLGLPAQSPVSEHLDTENGRIYFRLELKALQAALRAPVNKRRHHLEQAILFRLWRYELFPGARVAEVALERNEGLAEFTGVYVSGIAGKDTGYLPGLVEHAATSYPTFTRSFAYITGPLYGMLLSQKQAGWQGTLQPEDDFVKLLIKVYKLQVPLVTREAVANPQQAYDEVLIRREEAVREEKGWPKKRLMLPGWYRGLYWN